MNDLVLRALSKADEQTDPAVQRLWVVAAIDAAVGRTNVVVGGAAVDLHTGQYRPTDVDLIGFLSKPERALLHDAGFKDVGSRHVAWSTSNDAVILVEFPSSHLESDFFLVELEPGVEVAVITLEGLVLDRMIQATHSSGVEFEEAVALVVATAPRVDWSQVAELVNTRPDAGYLGLVAATRSVLEAADEGETADRFFS